MPPRKNLKKPAVVIKSSSRSIVKNTENEVYILKEKLFAKIEELEPKMVQTLCDLVAIPAISPADGGVGEFHKAEYLIKKLKELGLCDVSTYALPDPKAAGGERPNLVVRFPGRTERRLWIVAHMDVVPEGERSLWHTDPFKAEIKDGRIYGRGTSDNGQELVASLYALCALKELGVTPEYEVCLAFDAAVSMLQHLVSAILEIREGKRLPQHAKLMWRYRFDDGGIRFIDIDPRIMPGARCRRLDQIVVVPGFAHDASNPRWWKHLRRAFSQVCQKLLQIC